MCVHRLSCVQPIFVRSCPDFCAFISRLSSVQQAFVLSCPDVHPVSCVQLTFVRLPDFRAFKMSFARSSTFVRSTDFRAIMSRLMCVRQTFVLSPDFRSFVCGRLSVHPTFVQSTSFRAFMFKLSCVCQTFVRLKCLLYVNVLNFVRSCPDFCAFNRFSCVHLQTFKRSTDFRSFRSRRFSVQPAFGRSTNFRAFMSKLLTVYQTFLRL